MEKQHIDIYQVVTDRIVTLLEQGVIPWKKPWTGGEQPMNLLTQKPYRGINTLLLNSLHFKQNYFLTFEQVKVIGGSVKKGEKSQMIVFWKRLPSKDAGKTEEEKKEQKLLLRYYHVFNIAQCTGIPEKLIPQPTVRAHHDPIAACDALIEAMPNKPQIQHLENEAYYLPKQDVLNMPEYEYFAEPKEYYGILFHELIHSTGHSNRLNRKELAEMAPFGSQNYSTEELIAEIGACYLQTFTDIVVDDFANNAAYIQGWLAKFKNDKRVILYASSQAQKATDYILNVQYEHTEEHETVKQPEPQMA